jgi:hypothetical protein
MTAAESAQSLVPAYGQRSLWFLHEIQPGTAEHSIAAVLRFRDGLDIAEMEYVLDAFAARNASLQVDDVSDLDDAELTERIEDAAHEPFHLDRGPLLRVRLYYRGPRETVVLIVAHHLAADLGSMITLVREIEMLYTEQAGDTPAPLPELTDFVRHHSWISRSRVPGRGTSGNDRDRSAAGGVRGTWAL